jgi:hypothetical protein
MTDETMMGAGEMTGAVPPSGPALITEDLMARHHDEDMALGTGAASLANVAPTGWAG